MEQKVYTVSELNYLIRGLLEDAFPEVWVEGEVSNYRVYPSGHHYFSLKDAESQISAVIFRNSANGIKFQLENGLQVIARGRISCFTKRGEYQLVINALEPAGKGALQLAFEQLKAKLDKEGLFNPARKKKIPLLPRRIGVVTSPSGAAIRDILTVIDRRFANVEILIYPVRVQGEEAKTEIAQAISDLNRYFPQLDVLLVGRGGGSYEDLWAFNEEIVARAIAGSKIPVISCVGHEIDFTIADFVADLRAATPSAAAELVVRNKEELARRIQGLTQRLTNNIDYLLSHSREWLLRVLQNRYFQRPLDWLAELGQSADTLWERLVNAVRQFLVLKEREFTLSREKLQLLSPVAILNRGYAIVWKEPGLNILRDATEVTEKEKVLVRLSRGKLRCQVESVEDS